LEHVEQHLFQYDYTYSIPFIIFASNFSNPLSWEAERTYY